MHLQRYELSPGFILGIIYLRFLSAIEIDVYMRGSEPVYLFDELGE